MIWVALCAVAATLATSLAWLRYAASLQRAHARREDLLINQLMHLAGRSWQPPPNLPDPALAQLEERYLYDPERILEGG